MMFVPGTNLPDTDFKVINSCNGLVCMRTMCERRIIYVCNPILGEYITIPMKQRRCGRFLAFGFSSLSNQYKVLKSFSYLDKPLDTHIRAEIYPVGSGQWRSIANPPFSLYVMRVDVFLNDSVHWIDSNPENDGFICAFDFGCEQYRRLPLSPDSQIHDGWRRYSVPCLGVLNDCLFMAFDVCLPYREIEIWVMVKYGVKESWSKKFLVGHSHSDKYFFCKPLFFLSSGEILMLVRDEGILCYDPKSKKFQDTGISQGMKSINVIAYKPSFVSLQDIKQGEALKVLR